MGRRAPKARVQRSLAVSSLPIWDSLWLGPYYIFCFMPPYHTSSRLSTKFGILMIILILCVPESLGIRTSSAINPQSRSDRVRGKRLLDSVVPSCNWFCVFYNSARPCGLRVYPALFYFAYLLRSQRPSGCSLLESILLPWRCSFSPSASKDPDRPRLIHEAMVGVEVSAPSREWRAGFLFEV